MLADTQTHSHQETAVEKDPSLPDSVATHYAEV